MSDQNKNSVRSPSNEQGHIIEVDGLSFTSLKDSNLFLRALWAVLRSQHGRLGWQYTPHKSGKDNTISFGWMTMGSTHPAEIKVSIGYKKRGIIQSISFEIVRKEKLPILEIESGLRAAVSEAATRMKTPLHRRLNAWVATSPRISIAPYQGLSWSCSPIGGNRTEIGLDVSGFDDEDLKLEFSVRLEQLLDALSCMTNAALDPTGRTDSADRNATSVEVNAYLIEKDWLDDFGVEGVNRRVKRVHIAA